MDSSTRSCPGLWLDWQLHFPHRLLFHSEATSVEPFSPGAGWGCWAMWTIAVSLRWIANVYETYWRALLPISAAMEMAALVLFLRAVSAHRLQSNEKTDQRWVMIVMAGVAGLVAALGMNLFESVRLALSGSGPAFPSEFDQKLLGVMAWGFMVPFVWGFSTKWLPVFLGLRQTKIHLMLWGTVLNMAGVIAVIVGYARAAAGIWIVASGMASIALQIFWRSTQSAKTKGVHQTFPVFVRMAYVWLMIAGGLAVWASLLREAIGIWELRATP